MKTGEYSSQFAKENTMERSRFETRQISIRNYWTHNERWTNTSERNWNATWLRVEQQI